MSNLLMLSSASRSSCLFIAFHFFASFAAGLSSGGFAPNSRSGLPTAQGILLEGDRGVAKEAPRLGFKEGEPACELGGARLLLVFGCGAREARDAGREVGRSDARDDGRPGVVCACLDVWLSEDFKDGPVRMCCIGPDVGL